MLESLTIPGDRVLVESPCYVGALALIQALGREAVPVPVDRNGMNTERLASLLQKGDAKLLFTVPTFHNPTGMTFGRTRRERILALTRPTGCRWWKTTPTATCASSAPASPPAAACRGPTT